MGVVDEGLPMAVARGVGRRIIADLGWTPYEADGRLMARHPTAGVAVFRDRSATWHNLRDLRPDWPDWLDAPVWPAGWSAPEPLAQPPPDAVR